MFHVKRLGDLMREMGCVSSDEDEEDSMDLNEIDMFWESGWEALLSIRCYYHTWILTEIKHNHHPDIDLDLGNQHDRISSFRRASNPR